MKAVWMSKHGRGFLPVDDDAQKVHQRMEVGEAAPFTAVRVRDIKSHRRYWKLMELCAEHCERIELPYGGVMIVSHKNHVHTAIKLCTGHVDTIFDAFGKPAYQIPKSTDFESMTADEWAEYWPRVLDVVQEQVLPGVSIDAVQFELLKCMGLAA